MAEIVTTGARVVPAKALVLGYHFQHPRLGEALGSAIGGVSAARPTVRRAPAPPRADAPAGSGSR